MNATDPIPPDDPDELPEISQLMPLHDFPPFQPNVSEARPLTSAESRELVLRHVVQERRQVRCKSKTRRIRVAMLAAGALLAIFGLPTVEQLLIDAVDHEATAVTIASRSA